MKLWITQLDSLFMIRKRFIIGITNKIYQFSNRSLDIKHQNDSGLDFIHPLMKRSKDRVPSFAEIPKNDIEQSYSPKVYIKHNE